MKLATMLRTWPWLLVVAIGVGLAVACARKSEPLREHRADLSTSVVIAEVYGGGGNSGAPFDHDYVVLFNRGAMAVSLAGLQLQYASAAGAFQASGSIVSLPNVTLGAGQYYLVQLAGTVAGNGQPLPLPDLSATIAISSVAGKLVLTKEPLDGCGSSSNPCDLSRVLDLVGYGLFTTAWEGTSGISGTSNVLSAHRKSGGCEETDDNSLDFEIGAPTPKTTATSLQPCFPPDAGAGGSAGAAGAGGAGGASGSSGAEGASGVGGEGGSSAAGGASGTAGATGAAGASGEGNASGSGGAISADDRDASFGSPDLRGVHDRNGGCAASSRSPSTGPLLLLVLVMTLRRTRRRLAERASQRSSATPV